MVNNGLGLLSLEDDLSFLRSIMDYVKDTRTKKLDFRAMSEDSSEDLNIHPILLYLNDSEITEFHLGSVKITGRVQALNKALRGTMIEKLTLPDLDNVDDILSLMSILKDTRIIKLGLWLAESVFLKNGQFDEFVSHLTDSKLTSLKIVNGKISSFEVLFQKLPSTQITRLILRDVEAECQIIESISNVQFSALTNLELKKVGLGDSVVKAIGAVLKNSKLKQLNLSYNHISDTGVDALVPGLSHSKIEFLSLEGNKIKGENILADHLKDTAIQSLNLSKNPLSNKNRIFGNPNFLKSSAVSDLELEDCFRTTEMASSPVQMSLLTVIKDFQFSKLRSLNLSNNNLNFEHISALAALLRHLSLINIDLSDNEFSEACYIMLGDGLIQSKLRMINLSSTARSDESIRAIAYFLKRTEGSNLTHVELRSNNIWSEFGIIAPTLANTSLRWIDLSCNGKPTSTAVIRSLSQQLNFTAIMALDLEENNMGDEGAENLANCLGKTQIVLLNLRANLVTSRGAKALALALQGSKLRALELGYNRIEDDGLESLAEHAANTCITHLDVSYNPGKRTRLVDGVIWENRKKAQQFADLLKRTLSSEICLLDSVSSFDEDQPDAATFVDDCLKLCKFVSKEPFVVGVIEHDKKMLGSVLVELSETQPNNEEVGVLIEDCELIYKEIVEHPSPVRETVGHDDVSFFKKQALWFILEHCPAKLASISNRAKSLVAASAAHPPLARL